MSQVGPSTLRRANDLALSQWKYVAMVVKKVAEKRTQVRMSRVRPERRPSLLAAHGLSVMPLERNASMRSEESLVFAPEEERSDFDNLDGDDDDDEGMDVSVYDETGKPLLIPNLSDLFNELHSDKSSNNSTIFEESEGPSGEGREAEPRSPAHISAPHSSEDCTADLPEIGFTQPVPPTEESTNAQNGGAFRSNRQTYAAPPYARAQEQRYRQQLMQQQRQQLLLQQQRLQQQNYHQQKQQQQQPPRSYNASSPHAAYRPNGATTTNYGNNKNSSMSISNSDGQLPKMTVGSTGRPHPQPDIRFGPRLTAGQSRFVDMTALTGIRLSDARVIKSPVWSALEPGRD